MANLVDSGIQAVTTAARAQQGTLAVEIYLPNGTRILVPSGDVATLRLCVKVAGELPGTAPVPFAVPPVGQAAHDLSKQNKILERLERIEIAMRVLTGQERQDWYDTATAARLLGKTPYSVREWCRLGRVRAEKRACGRGRSKEWMISHKEVMRIKAEGLLPLQLRGRP